MRGIAAILVGMTLVVMACTGRVGAFYCPTEALRATLPMPLAPGEDAFEATLVGNLESRVNESATLDAIEAAVEGQAIGSGISLWLQRGLDHTMNVSLWFPTPLRPGDVLPVVGAHSTARGLFWGTIPDPPAGLSVAVALDDFAATSATGTARVLGVNPLRVELDVTASGGGRDVPLEGVLTVRHETEADTCFE